jgi:hypothetical protein
MKTSGKIFRVAHCRSQEVSGIIKTGKKFVISSEPDKIKYPQQHYFWNEIRNQKKHTFIDVSELEIIEEYAKTHQVKPLE